MRYLVKKVAVLERRAPQGAFAAAARCGKVWNWVGVIRVRRVALVAARWLGLGAIAFGLAACFFSQPSIESVPHDQRAQSVTDQIRAIDLSPRQGDPVQTGGNPRPSRAAVYLGNVSAGMDSPNDGSRNLPAGEGYDLNFENAPVTTVAKVVLGDIMGAGY